MMRVTADHNVVLEAALGDITLQNDIDVIVNAANAQLASGGGVAGAIHRAAGEALYEACKPLAPILPGQAVLTPAFNLPNKAIIHCLGPVYGQDEPSEVLLAQCYKNALLLLQESGFTSIAFPAISTGIFGFPAEPACVVTMNTIRAMLPSLSTIKTIRFVLWSEPDYQLYCKHLYHFE